jgi:hypothetical protein
MNVIIPENDNKILVKANQPPTNKTTEYIETPSCSKLPSSPDPGKFFKNSKTNEKPNQNLTKLIKAEPVRINHAGPSAFGNYEYHGGLNRCDVNFTGGTNASNINYAPPTYSKGHESFNLEEGFGDFDDLDKLFDQELQGITPELIDKLLKLHAVHDKNTQLKLMNSQIDHQIYSAKKRLESAKHAFLLSQASAKLFSKSDESAAETVDPIGDVDTQKTVREVKTECSDTCSK